MFFTYITYILQRRKLCTSDSKIFVFLFVSSSSLSSVPSDPVLTKPAVSVKNLVDLYGKDELIYLGPDEQVSAHTVLRYDVI
jgi:hypothetical protein